MKTIVQINTAANGSTGKIMRSIQKAEVEKGYRSISVFARNNVTPEHEYIKFGSKPSIYAHAALTRLFDMHGLGSKHDTLNLIKHLQLINPDIIHLHNIHGYYLNYELLFSYLKSSETPVIWTLHDCWAFTGHCAHFEHIGCLKYKTGCYKCPEKKGYPQSMFLDGSSRNYRKKRTAFCSLENLTIVTPSDWLAEHVRQSYLSKYNCVTINNGIDTSVFAPTVTGSRKAKYNIPNNSFVILSVSSLWDESKGFSVLLKLAELFSDCAVVIVGLREKQLEGLPPNVIAIKRTENIRELAEIYSLADVFVNPTKIETMSLVNVEAQACGTPVISYEAGGSGETLAKGSLLVPQGDFDAMSNAVERYRAGDFEPLDVESVRNRFSMQPMCERYLKLIENNMRG